MERTIYSVSEVNRLIKSLLDEEPALQRLLVRGELSNYKIYPSGHHYFTLKDSEGSLRCVMFADRASRLRFRPENGMSVVLSGRVSVFPRDGAYQLYCETLTPEGAGELAIAFEQLKAKLYAEGLFNPAHKKPLPRFPERIAIVTSSAGAAVHDMIRILRRHYPLAKVILLPVRVQGVEAPPEIAGAIRYANRWNVADVIITGRGGGSMEDLWAFNDERVARAIFESRIPVISAVGHEPDVTISDFVADARASTPSNAAEIAVPDAMRLRGWLQDSAARISQAETLRLQRIRARLRELAAKRVLQNPLAYTQDKRMLLIRLQERLGDLTAGTLARRRAKFGALAAALDAMSPLKVLGRGYAMAQDADGKILRRGGDVTPGQRVTVTLGEGGFRATVDKVTMPGAGNAKTQAPDAGNVTDGAKTQAPDAGNVTEAADGMSVAAPDAAETPPKKRRGRPRKTPLPESAKEDSTT